MGAEIKNKTKSQITIFVIIAIILVVAIALVFIVFRNIQKSSGAVNAEEEPKLYIENCISKNLEAEEEKIIETNLYPKIETNYMLYSGQNVPYLCKSSQFYTPCINQEPSLLNHVRKEIKDNLGTEKCFEDLIKLLRNRGYSVNEESLNVSLDFYGGGISADINKKLSIKKDESTRIYDKFSANINSPIYSLVNTANTIVNYESALCEFNSDSWMKTNRDIIINKFTASDSSKVYTLTDEKTAKKISFAVKGCVLPAGL